MKCEIIQDGPMWFLQYERDDGQKRCCLMDAENEIDAQHEAIEEGFTEIRVCRQHKPVTQVTIPKSPFP